MIYIYGFKDDSYVTRIENLCVRNNHTYMFCDLDNPFHQRWFYEHGHTDAPVVYEDDTFVGSFNDIVHYIWMKQRLETEGLN
jgi:hypothetical protein